MNAASPILWDNTQFNVQGFNERPSIQIDDFLMTLTFPSPSGGANRYVYDTLAGAVDQATSNTSTNWAPNLNWLKTSPALSQGGPRVMSEQANTTVSLPNTSDVTNTGTPFPIAQGQMGYMLKPDPRTSRYGVFPSYGLGAPIATALKISDAGIVAVWGDPGTTSVNNYLVMDSNAAQYFSGYPVLPSGFVDLGISNSTFTGRCKMLPGAFPLGSASGPSLPSLPSVLLNIPDRPQDGSVYRPNISFFGSAANPLGTATPTAVDSPTRPMILQRPFRNVAELGHVFRDQPWKNLSFFHESSPDLALLDIFQTTEVESETEAGKVNLNSVSQQVLESMFRGTGITLERNAISYGANATVSQAQELAQSANATITDNKSLSLADASAKIIQDGNSTITTNLGTIKAEREGLARALAGTTQTRTWNLLIDVIAQAGRRTGGSNFNVEGEARYWVHLAIDRFTGEAVDVQYEPVTE
jgi:hypothetical protein